MSASSLRVLTPSAAAYVRSLPSGLDAYPNAQTKGSVLRFALEGYDRSALRDALPTELHSLTDATLPVSSWISEAHASVLYLTSRDLFFSSDEDYVADMARRNEDMVKSPLYRGLARLLGPRHIATAGAKAFNTLLHRGLRLQAHGGGIERWTLSYPPHLVPELLARCYGTSVTSALRSAGCEADYTLLSHGPHESTYAVVTR